MTAPLNVLGVAVSAVDMGDALSRIDGWIEHRERTYVCVCSVHGVMECRRSEELRKVFNRAGMVTPDGMPLVWLGRASGHKNIRRVYGPDLMLAELARSQHRGRRHFFYGGADGVAARLAERMASRFPGLEVTGVLQPGFGPLEELCTPEVAEGINQARPDIVWVGLSTPKQELWIARMRPLLEAPVLIGVGAAFDFHGGRIRQAPRWMQRIGMEWLFRLLMEPGRLWRRYLVNNPWFVYELLMQRLGVHRFEINR